MKAVPIAHVIGYGLLYSTLFLLLWGHHFIVLSKWLKTITTNGGANDKEDKKHFAADTNDNAIYCLQRIACECSLHSRDSLQNIHYRVFHLVPNR